MANELAKVDVESFALVKADPVKTGEMIRANIGDRDITAGQLDRIKVPSGGATNWNIMGLDGEESMKELQGIIMHWTEPRAFWLKQFGTGEAGARPDCASDDSTFGVGDPGGLCSKCPNAQYGTKRGPDGKLGKGQACKQIRQLFLIQRDELLPMIVNVPPASLKACSQYFLRLASKLTPYWGVVTNLRLTRCDMQGAPYAKIDFSVGAKLGGEQITKIEALRKAILPALGMVVADPKDFHGADEAESTGA